MSSNEININITRLRPALYCYRYGGVTSPWYSNGDSISSLIRSYKPDAVSTPVPPPDTVREVTPWYRDVVRCQYGDIMTEDNFGSIQWFYTASSAFSSGIPAPIPYDDEFWERAINGALEKLKKQSVNLSVAFAERGKTASLLSETAQRIAKQVQKFRDLRGGKLWRRTVEAGSGLVPRVRDYPSEYLKMAYGWSPLLQDIHGSAEALSQREQRGNNPYYVRVSKKFELTDGEFTDSSGFMNWGGWNDMPVYGAYSKREGARATFYYRLNHPVLSAFSSLGLTNPAAVAWELTPFSFVYDWMHPVGNWLNLMDADFGWLYLDGGVSRWQERTFRGQHCKVPPHSRVVSGNASQCTWFRFKMDRSKFTSAPWPVPPSFRNPFTSTRRVSSALALVAVLTGKNGRPPSVRI